MARKTSPTNGLLAAFSNSRPADGRLLQLINSATHFSYSRALVAATLAQKRYRLIIGGDPGRVALRNEDLFLLRIALRLL